MKRKKGFTLVEVVIAMIMIAIIAVTGFEFLRHVQYFIIVAGEELVALNLAREKTEELYWDSDLKEMSPVTDDVSDYLPGGRRTYSVGNSAGGDYKIISVSVTKD